MAKARTHEEKLFAAAVMRRSFELRGEQGGEGFRFVYQGVLRDLGLEDGEVTAFLKAHFAEVEQAIGRRS